MHAALWCCMWLQLPSGCSIQPSCKPHLRLCAAGSPRLLLLQAQVVSRRLTAGRMKQHKLWQSQGLGAIRRWPTHVQAAGKAARLVSLEGPVAERDGLVRARGACWDAAQHSQLALRLVRHRQVLLALLEGL